MLSVESITVKELLKQELKIQRIIYGCFFVHRRSLLNGMVPREQFCKHCILVIYFAAISRDIVYYVHKLMEVANYL